MGRGDIDEEFCFGHAEFVLLDILVETSGRLLDRWVWSSEVFLIRLWAESCNRKNKTQFLHPYLCPGITGHSEGVREGNT